MNIEAEALFANSGTAGAMVAGTSVAAVVNHLFPVPRYLTSDT